MEIEFANAKTNRFDQNESRETTEVFERPNGGQSLIFCDGSRDGTRSKTASSVIVNKIIGHLADGSRDGATIRSVSDQIYREFGGQLKGNLAVITADFETNTLVVSRCMDVPVFFYQRGHLGQWAQPSQAIGTEKGIRPSITEIPIEAGTMIFALSPGAYHAGNVYEVNVDWFDLLLNLLDDHGQMSASELSNFLLARAIRHDQHKPQKDMAVHVIRVTNGGKSNTRRMTCHLPVPPEIGMFDEDER